MDPSGQGRPQGGEAFWWIIPRGLLIWNAAAFWPSAKPEVHIPYSAFLGQVRGDSISDVLIIGPRISGELVNPILWPEPAAQGKSSSAQSAQSGTVKGSDPANAGSSASGKSASQNKAGDETGKWRSLFPTAKGGAPAAAPGGLDTFIFTGGIGERSAAIRARIWAPLEFFGIRLDRELNENNSRSFPGATVGSPFGL